MKAFRDIAYENGHTTTYAYDSINRETKSIDPLGNVTTYAYNAASDLASTIDRDGRTITNAYDADDRLTTQVWLNSSGTATNTLTYAYDADSDLTVAANNAGTYTMSYDKLGDMTAEREPFGATLTMAYDAVGNRTQVADSFGGVTTSAYDADDRLTEREFSNGTTPLSFDMSYTSRSQLASVTRYNSLTQNGSTEVGSSAYTYNAEGLLTNLQHNSGTSSGGNLFNTTYTYDLNDRLTSISQAGSSPVTYTYNALNELTGDTSSATPTYSYDANGNRTNPGDTVGTDNQISTDGTWTYTYDKEGNVTQKTDAAGDKWQYTYDNANELVGATYTPTGTTVASTVCTYVYDVFGNKIEQEETVSGTTTITKFAYDGSTIWAAMSSSNALQTRYVYMDGSTTPVAQISSGGTVNWYDTDYEGSVRLIVSNTGSVVDTIKYDAYGNILSQSAPVSGQFVFYAGGQYDSVLQLILWGNDGGWYNPGDGTWMRQDPLFPDSGTDPYGYCYDDPANLTDPTGLGVGELEAMERLKRQKAEAERAANTPVISGVDFDSPQAAAVLWDHIKADAYRLLGPPQNNWDLPPFFYQGNTIYVHPAMVETLKRLLKTPQIQNDPVFRDLYESLIKGTAKPRTITGNCPGNFAAAPRVIITPAGTVVSGDAPTGAVALAPVVGNLQRSANAQVNGNYGQAVLYDILAATDVVGLGLLAGLGRTTTQTSLTAAAQRANASVGAGRGAVHGTRVHTAFEAEVNALGNSNLTTEVSYLNGVRVQRGTPGSVRLDVVEGPLTAPTAIYDLKTGGATLTPERIQQIQQHMPGGANVPVIEIR